jgi:FdrA protein
MENNAVDLLIGPILAINVGVQDFGETLEQQDVPVVYVEWTPPAGGDQEMIDLLDMLL